MFDVRFNIGFDRTLKIRRFQEKHMKEAFEQCHKAISEKTLRGEVEEKYKKRMEVLKEAEMKKIKRKEKEFEELKKNEEKKWKKEGI